VNLIATVLFLCPPVMQDPVPYIYLASSLACFKSLQAASKSYEAYIAHTAHTQQTALDPR
jgi:hypothetical protein